LEANVPHHDAKGVGHAQCGPQSHPTPHASEPVDDVQTDCSTRQMLIDHFIFALAIDGIA
jgi:hypothetical protein